MWGSISHYRTQRHAGYPHCAVTCGRVCVGPRMGRVPPKLQEGEVAVTVTDAFGGGEGDRTGKKIDAKRRGAPRGERVNRQLVRVARESVGFTQAELADIAGHSERTQRNLEKGLAEGRGSRLFTISLVARVLGLPEGPHTLPRRARHNRRRRDTRRRTIHGRYGGAQHGEEADTTRHACGEASPHRTPDVQPEAHVEDSANSSDETLRRAFVLEGLSQFVGLVGLEPTASSSRTMRATNCAIARYVS